LHLDFFLEFAVLIRDLVGNTKSEINRVDPVEDDPQKRRPDITKAKKLLKWEPVAPLKVGLDKTIEYFRKELQKSSHSERNIFQPQDLIPESKE
jgi:UDP-glucuronate decarboxylase